jgi:hypothetical protein
MERPIDFRRERHMRCGSCGYEFVADLDWIDRWEQSGESCSGCGVTCEVEQAPRVTADPDDLALRDEKVAQLFWYHTSVHPDWPAEDFDPAGDFTPATRLRMGGDARVAAWAARQRRNALHIGTYEAAVHNMLRRISDQGDQGKQFYMYRVHLKPSVVVREGWLIDPSNWLGDVLLTDVCPAGVDVARYLNYYEDAGGLSLVLGRDAIAEVQQVAIPLPEPRDEKRVRDVVAELESASDELVAATGKLKTIMTPSSPRSALARAIAETVAAPLPPNLRWPFETAVPFDGVTEPAPWARRMQGLLDLIMEPDRALEALDEAVHRRV